MAQRYDFLAAREEKMQKFGEEIVNTLRKSGSGIRYSASQILIRAVQPMGIASDRAEHDEFSAKCGVKGEDGHDRSHLQHGDLFAPMGDYFAPDALLPRDFLRVFGFKQHQMTLLLI